MSGLFVNMKNKSAYQWFNRDLHVAKEKMELDTSLAVNLCFDFNVEPFCMTICQDVSIFNREQKKNIIKENQIMVIDEIILKGGKSNSYDMVEEIKGRLPRECSVVLFGDSSGNAHKTVGVSTDWEIIRQGLEPHFRNLIFSVERSNPPVEHRINTVNYHLRKNNIVLNKHCSFLVNDFEQVSYKENGKLDDSNKMLTHVSDGFGYYIYKKFSIYGRNYS